MRLREVALLFGAMLGANLAAAMVLGRVAPPAELLPPAAGLLGWPDATTIILVAAVIGWMWSVTVRESHELKQLQLNVDDSRDARRFKRLEPCHCELEGCPGQDARF